MCVCGGGGGGGGGGGVDERSLKTNVTGSSVGEGFKACKKVF